MLKITIKKGFAEKDRKAVAALYTSAFKRKFEKLIGDEQTVAGFLEKGLNPNYCFSCYSADTLVGILGFHIGKENLVSPTLSDFIKQFGLFRGVYKAVLSEFIFRKKAVSKKELLMDGVAVDKNFRGQGVGSALFDEFFVWAKAQGYEAVHLDVIDENPKAKALYERLGFVKTAHEKVPNFIKKMIGVSGVTHMRKPLY